MDLLDLSLVLLQRKRTKKPTREFHLDSAFAFAYCDPELLFLAPNEQFRGGFVLCFLDNGCGMDPGIKQQFFCNHTPCITKPVVMQMHKVTFQSLLIII